MTEGPTEYGAFVVHSVLDTNRFSSLNSLVRGEIQGQLNKSMSHGLEKFWAQPGNTAAIKLWLDVWQKHTYKDSDNEFS